MSSTINMPSIYKSFPVWEWLKNYQLELWTHWFTPCLVERDFVGGIAFLKPIAPSDGWARIFNILNLGSGQVVSMSRSGNFLTHTSLNPTRKKYHGYAPNGVWNRSYKQMANPPQKIWSMINQLIICKLKMRELLCIIKYLVSVRKKKLVSCALNSHENSNSLGYSISKNA